MKKGIFQKLCSGTSLRASQVMSGDRSGPLQTITSKDPRLMFLYNQMELETRMNMNKVTGGKIPLTVILS